MSKEKLFTVLYYRDKARLVSTSIGKYTVKYKEYAYKQ